MKVIHKFNKKTVIVCGGRDLNPRTPARIDLESITFGRLVTPASQGKLNYPH